MHNLIVFLVATITSFIFTIPAIYLAKRLNLVTDKKARRHPAHTHSGLVPRGGGVPIYLALLLSVIIFLPISKIISGILISSALLMIIGILDDYFDLSPYLRFPFNILISALAIGFGLGIPYISNPFGGIIELDKLRVK